MATRLAIDSVEVATIEIDVPNTIGQYGPDYPTLCVTLKVSLLLYRRYDGPTQPITLLYLRALLLLANTRIAESQSSPNLYAERLEHPLQHRLALELPLDMFRLRRIEGQRHGDLQAMLHLEGVFAVHGSTGITRFAKSDAYDLRLDLPQSYWTAKVLPGLGYHQISIVELPFPASMVDEFCHRSSESVFF